MPVVDRRISCRKAVWSPPILMTLEQLLKAVLTPVPPEDPEQTREDFGDRKIETRHWDLDNLLLLHVAAWSDGLPASTVPHGNRTGDLGVQPAPPGSDFLRGDGMVLVKDDYCLVMPCGITAPTVISYIRELIGKRGMQMGEVICPNVLKLVNRKGVKAIKLNIVGHAQPERGQEPPATLRRRVVQFIREDAFTRREDRGMMRSASNVDAQMTVKLDMKRPGITPTEFARMLSAEEEGLSEEGVTIVMADGQEIREGSLVLRTKAAVDSSGDTIDHRSAWQELERYFQSLQDQNLIPGGWRGTGSS